MNYILLHEKFLDYFKNTNPRERLLKKNHKDKRLNKENIYVEIHHIIPKHDGGCNGSFNLVALLPEEHVFIHKLRYKAFGQRGDMLSVRFVINGMKGNKRFDIDGSNMHLTKSILNGYAFIKSNSHEFRKNIGWHTPNGAKRISESRKGTMPVKDKDTLEIIGSVSCQHHKVLSGQWVHHSKGVKHTEKRKLSMEFTGGDKNNNYSGYSDEQLIKNFIEICGKLGYIPGHKTATDFGVGNHIYFPKKICGFRFNGSGFNGVIKIIEDKTGLKYDPYYTRRSGRSSTIREKRCWVTDGVNSKSIKEINLATHILQGWKKGRIINGKSNKIK